MGTDMLTGFWTYDLMVIASLALLAALFIAPAITDTTQPQ